MDLSKLAAILSASRRSRRYELACGQCQGRALTGDWYAAGDGETEAFGYRCDGCGEMFRALDELVRVA